MIQLYAPGNENFEMNGDITLFPEDCDVVAELGGTWVANLTHPIDEDGRWKHIVKEAVVSVPTFMGKNQLFRIDETEKQDEEIIAKAYPIFFDSADEVFLMDKRPTSKTGQEALDILTDGTKYKGVSDIESVNTTYFVRRNLLDAINGDAPSFLQVWGGEPLYDNYSVIINSRAGGDYGAEVRYGMNMGGVSFKEDMSSVVTRIVPVAFNGLTHSEEYIDSPLIHNYAKIYTREIKFEDVKMESDLTDGEDTDGLIICQTQEELDAALLEKCNEQFEAGIDLYSVTITVNMISLENTEEYKDFESLIRIGLGDTVRCYNSRLGITTEARAIKITWDCIDDAVQEVVLGDYETSFLNEMSSAIGKIENTNPVNSAGDIMAERVVGVLNGMKTQFKVQSTAAQKVNSRVILFEDLDTNSKMYGALALGTLGIQIANKRTADGLAWDWSTAMTVNGILADVIVAGIIADKKGKSYWNLDTGEFVLSPETKITWDQITGTDGIAKSADIPTKVSKLENDKGYQNSEQVTTIIKNTITKEYIDALKVISGSVAAENITGKTLSGKKFIASGKRVFSAADYTSDDLTIAQEIIAGTREMTSAYMQKYDFEGKGFLDSNDLLKIQELVNGTVDEYTLDISVEIDGIDQNTIINTSGVLIGMNGMYAKNLGCNTIKFFNVNTVNEAGDACVGVNGSFTTADGQTVSVANGIIVGIAEEVQDGGN